MAKLLPHFGAMVFIVGFLHFRIADTMSMLLDGAGARQREMLVRVARSINYEREPPAQFRSS
ncbi:MAG: hypothetical protein AAB177_01110, partial [Nitrospirota bacterium]